ncbi:pyridoxal-phosphate dependent enzyme [Hahella aquimaris]|uniref:threonine ammonia-lyase n=1 Tax=Hahella sp. HNIBRBA332 TaxID=3015983 RepID=UPI00273CF2A4|nr:pyridoxal-phosphate dependent enzyme [Hahella sp. HNIBRBA332]WLQ17330.1 pyridoxal-phosphate dependent enzyme [Hahella sp. HNIBRBA332]
MKDQVVDIRDIFKARQTVSRNLKPTQLLRYESLSRLIGADIYIKHENHNPTASQKIRGAVNLAWELRRNGVTRIVTAANGASGVALACAARLFNMSALVVVPEKSPLLLIQSIQDQGAEVRANGIDFPESLRIARRMEENGDFYFVHPANEMQFIHGCATAALEVIEELPEADVAIGSVGMGGCIASTLAASSVLSPKLKVIGVQAESAPAAYLSWKTGALQRQESRTFSQELGMSKAFETPFSLYTEALTDFVLLPEHRLYEGVALAAHHTRQMVDAVGGAPIMAAYLLRQKLRSKTVVLFMSSGVATADELEEAYTLSAFRSGKPEEL